jgi:hypothetical protein
MNCNEIVDMKCGCNKGKHRQSSSSTFHIKTDYANEYGVTEEFPVLTKLVSVPARRSGFTGRPDSIRSMRLATPP